MDLQHVLDGPLDGADELARMRCLSLHLDATIHTRPVEYALPIDIEVAFGSLEVVLPKQGLARSLLDATLITERLVTDLKR